MQQEGDSMIPLSPVYKTVESQDPVYIITDGNADSPVFPQYSDFWRPYTVKNILMNPVYTGKRIRRRRKVCEGSGTGRGCNHVLSEEQERRKTGQR